MSTHKTVHNIEAILEIDAYCFLNWTRLYRLGSWLILQRIIPSPEICFCSQGFQSKNSKWLLFLCGPVCSALVLYISAAPGETAFS
jgi:hypothetical protein